MQLIESEVDAPPEFVREVPAHWDSHIAAASADRHEGADVVLNVERVHCYHG